MGRSNGSIAIAAAVIVVLMLGTVYMYMFTQSQMEPDPHEETRHYTVTGTVGGLSCEGTCTAEYTPENSNYHTYRYSMEFMDSEGDTHSASFGMVFGSDDRPLEELYVFMGTDDEGAEVWTHSESGTRYTFHVSGYCTVTGFTVESDTLRLTASLASGT